MVTPDLYTHDLWTYGGFVPLSPQLHAEIVAIRSAEMIARIGPVHGPPLRPTSPPGAPSVATRPDRT